MINEEILKAAVSIITEKILTPILYMYEDEVTEFICFAGSTAPQEDFDDAERAVFHNLGIKCELVDIREFSENDRLKITSNADIVYTADPLVQTLFEHAMYTDVQRVISENHCLVQRKKDTSSYYIN